MAEGRITESRYLPMLHSLHNRLCMSAADAGGRGCHARVGRLIQTMLCTPNLQSLRRKPLSEKTDWCHIKPRKKKKEKLEVS